MASGEDGTNGSDGMNGMNGANGTSCTLVSNSNGTRTLTCGADGGSITVIDAVADYTVMTADEKAQAAMTAVITGVSFPADGRPVVKIKVSERHGLGVKNLSTTAATWRFALLKRATGVNGSANDTWVSYLAANDHSSASSETAAAANLTDRGDGSYDYRFAKVINGGPTAAGTTYEADKSHRLIVLLYASGNPFSPINLVKDFVPMTGADVTGQHETVDGNACLECHTTFRAISGGTGEFGSGEFHSGVRYDVRTCVGCHNDQRRFTSSGAVVAEPAIAADRTWTGAAAVLNGEAVINLPVFIHKIHMGTKLKLTGGSYAGIEAPYETTYPQDVRNCAKCHRAPAPLADHWKTQPSSRACGACHDDRSFEATLPAGRDMHTGGPQATDVGCSTCHQAGSTGGDTAAKHLPVSPPSPDEHLCQHERQRQHQRGLRRGGGRRAARRQGGDLRRAERVDVDRRRRRQRAAAADRVQVQARRHRRRVPRSRSGERADPGLRRRRRARISCSRCRRTARPPPPTSTPRRARTSATSGTAPAPARTPRRPRRAPARARSPGPDAMGFYTLRLTCATIPANATMLTGGIGYSYGLGSRQSPSNPDLDFVNNTQPFTQINLAAYPYVANKKADGVTPGYSGVGGLIVPPPDVSMVATGFTGRRAIVDNSKCGSCHVSLGVGPDFHAGQRNDAGTCNWCHRPNQTSSAWSANAKDFVHAIHGAEKRTTPFTWHQASPTEGFWKATYPGVLNKCEMCHLRRDVRLQHERGEGRLPQHARQHRRAGDVRGRQRARPLRDRRDRLWRRLQLQRAHGGDCEPRSHDAGRVADGRGVRVMPRHAHRHRSHADQRRLVLRIARRRCRQAAAGGVHALPRPQPHRVHRRPSRVLP